MNCNAEWVAMWPPMSSVPSGRPLGEASPSRSGRFSFTCSGPRPGHSDDSGSYYLPPTQGFPGAVFTGDTLFVGGCGRIFTSSSATMWSSLQLLAALPAETLVLWPRLLPGELRICCDRRASQRRSQGAT